MSDAPLSPSPSGSQETAPASLFVDTEIACDGWVRDVLNPIAAVETAAKAAMAVCGGPAGELSVLLTDDDAMQALNGTWRGKPSPTDVLAFPAAANGAGFLGDIAIGHGTCVRDAGDMGRPLRAHLAHMVIHAYLHLAGYDHQTDADAEIMEDLEDRALADLGFSAPIRGPV